MRFNPEAFRHIGCMILSVALGGMLTHPAIASTLSVSASSGADIQAAINRLPPEGGVVLIRSRKGGIPVSKSLVISRSNVTLAGEAKGSTVLKLVSGANAPVIVIGQTNASPSKLLRNIQVRNLTVDGNRANQTSELNAANPALRNNGITLRHVEDCSVENVDIRAARSGGLVTELGCRRLTISQVESSNNYFDGMAGYQTVESVFKNIFLHDNAAAGFSFDIDFTGNILSECQLVGNGSVGLFMRDSRDNVFSQFQVRNNGQHGAFLAQVDADAGTPASGNTFTGCVFGENGGAGIRINDASCTNNLASGCQFFGNAQGGISEPSASLLTVNGCISR